MERCCVCKARLKETSVCPRCNADLSLPLNIEQQAEILCSKALMLFGTGQLAEAIETLEQSIQLKSSPLALQLQGFIRRIE